ncbi:MAG TPA: septal ring lytic transglycosylase RlpA family protein [Pseudolabrys sp.]|jgi:rare lipoprotein A (peptidoglycan hydrolase)|nr:septal ring lytic transglycosylase RlpA family protein [Pseudolabrys sp.]
MTLIEKKENIVAWVKRTLTHLGLVVACGTALSAIPVLSVSSENTFDRIQAGEWVTASMYWEDKLVSTGKSFNPIGWHAAHKTLPMGTLIRVSNPKNHRSINVTINDRGPFVANRDLDLSLGAGTLLGLQGLGTVYMEVLSIPPIKNMQRPVVESLFAVNDANANCVGVSAC